MRKSINNFFAVLSAIAILISSQCFFYAYTAEDTSAPQLISVEVIESAVHAGNSITVRVCVKETETGLTQALLQFNHAERNNTLLVTKDWDTPQYSSGNSYIEFTLTVPTDINTRNGDWYIGHLEFYDQKGNFSRYCGNKNDNQMHSEFLEPQQILQGKTHVKITGANENADTFINSVEIINSVVNKPGVLKLKICVSDAPYITYFQINLQSESGNDNYIHQKDYSTNPESPGEFIIEIPINNNRHTGNWEISDIYFYDCAGNQVHYTSCSGTGYFEDSDGIAPEKFSRLMFTVTGSAADKTAPAVKEIKVLNEDGIVYKPGVMLLQIEIVEKDSGVSRVVVEYGRISDTEPDVSGRDIYEFSLEKSEENENRIELKKPLKSGKHILEVPVSSTKPNGNYEVYIRELVDSAENKYVNYDNSGLKTEFAVEDEYKYSFELGISNKNLLSCVQAMKDGDVGRILLGKQKEDNILSKEILDSIAGQNKTLVCYRDGYQWIFCGKDIEASKTKDLNLTARIFTVEGKNLSSGRQAVCISFENNGQLPGKVQFRFKSAFIEGFVGKAGALHLYHVENTEGGYETDIDYVNSEYTKIPSEKANFKVVLDDKDAWCYVDLTHNSKYIVSDSTLTKLSESNDKNTTDYFLGDVDGNKSISAADARLALRASVNLEHLSDKQFKAADADKNNTVTAADARLILRVSVNLESFS